MTLKKTPNPLKILKFFLHPPITIVGGGTLKHDLSYTTNIIVKMLAHRRMKMSVVNTNIIGNNSRRFLQLHQSKLATSANRLSSGLRINSAKDDAAGLAISDRLRAQVGGLSVAARNANDGISMIQTAEGAMNEVTNLLMRMRDLAVQAASDNNSSNDRISIQDEISQLRTEVTAIATNTAFGGGLKLLDGTFTSKTLHIGAYKDQNVSISINNAKASVLGRYSLNSSTANDQLTDAVDAATTVAFGTTNVNGDDLSITSNTVTKVGTTTSYTVSIDADASAEEIASAINAETSNTGVSASATTKVKIDNLNANGNVTFTLLSGSNTSNTSVAISSTAVTTSDLSALLDEINSNTSVTGVSASVGSSNAELILTHSEGAYIAIQDFTNDAADDETIDVTALTDDGTESAAATTLTSSVNDSSIIGGYLTMSASESFTVTEGTAADGLFNATTAQTASLSALSAMDASTQAGANNAIETIDGAIAMIDTNRATLGAIMNRLEASSKNALATRENVQVARSRVLDADFSLEVSEFTKNNVLMQAAQAMLTQGNSQPQLALQLLQNLG